MKRAIIVHCWDGNPKYCWYPSVKKQLEAKGFSVQVPAFPEPDAPRQAKWVPFLNERIGAPDDGLFLIGHSVGCVTILRYLETLKEGERVGGVVLVAGFTDNLGFDELKNYFETPIDLAKIRTKSKSGFVAIHSDDDPYVALKFGDVFKRELGAEVVIKHAMGHFSGPVDNEGSCTELPDVVSAVEKLQNSMNAPEGRPEKHEGHEKISPTAWGVAYRRTLAGIPYSEDIFRELEEIVRRTRSVDELAALESLRYPESTPMFEARYKLTNRLLKEHPTNQILELAAGFSPRGVEMAHDPAMQYVELDLPGVMDEKRIVLQRLIEQGKMPQQGNLHLEDGNALDAGDIERAVRPFGEGPVNVINEGLMRYLDFDEKATLAHNIHGLLERFGGAWITPDISMESADSSIRDEQMKERNAKMEKLTGVEFFRNRFKDEEAARKFFGDLGFSVERHGFIEMAGELTSPKKLDLSPDQVERLIGKLVVFVMKAKE